MSDKWEVIQKYTFEEDLKETIRQLHEENPEKWFDPEVYSINEVQDVEISVVRDDWEHGKNSYGWDCVSKIIIGRYCSTIKELQAYIIVADIVAKALNENDDSIPRISQY